MLFARMLPMRGNLLVALLPLMALLSVAMAALEAKICKDECNKNFKGDSLIEHPGVQSICHRGCELFTVAFIALPRGGVPLVVPKPGVIPPAIMATLDENGIPLGPANFPVHKKAVSNEKYKNKKPAAIQDKNEKEQEELDKSINKRIDNEMERMNVKRLISGEEETKETKKTEVKPVASKTPVKVEDKTGFKEPKLKYNIFGRLVDLSDFVKLTGKEIAELDRQMGIPHPEIIKQRENEKDTNSMPPPSHPDTDKMPSPRDGKPKNSFRQVVHSKIKADSEIKKPSGKHFERTFTGEEAREILNEVRSHKLDNVDTLPKHAASNIPHGPETKVSANVKVYKTHHSPSSKTTVQPLPLAVQDHPVHATRQITTDSSSADDRKTTTPKSSHPAALVPLNKIKQIHLVNKLGSKLGITKSKLIHPLLHITLLKPKPIVPLMMPQQVSIIEIVKKKNNIDFEKLHQEHMDGAAGSPQINERLEQAKHSCRHACVTAFSIAQEQDACVVGCHIRASSSAKQVEEQKILAKHPMLPFFGDDNSLLLGKDGIFSSVSRMFSSMAHNFDGFTGKGSAFNLARTSKDLTNKMDISSVENSGSVSTDGSGRQIINSKTVVHLKSPNKLQHRSEVNIVQDNEFKPIGSGPNVKDDLFKLPFEEPDDRHKEVDFLKKQFETMGFHLNEKPKESAQLQLPKFIKDIISGHGFKPMSIGEKIYDKSEIRESSNKLNLPPSNSFKTVMISENKDVQNVDESVKSDFAKTFSGFVVPSNFVRSESINLKPESIITVKQLQQLDLLECISRKSGLPRWVIGMTIFASALLVVWLSFSLYSPADESKLCKKKVPPTVVLCDGDHVHGCPEEKHLLPADECIKIRFQDV